jgi:hypothetical protein
LFGTKFICLLHFDITTFQKTLYNLHFPTNSISECIKIATCGTEVNKTASEIEATKSLRMVLPWSVVLRTVPSAFLLSRPGQAGGPKVS